MTYDETKHVVPAESADPLPPTNLSDEDIEKVQRQAKELIGQLEEATGSVEMELLDSVTNVGLQAQRGAAGQLGLLKTRISVYLSEGGTSKEIADGMRELRLTLDRINPQELSESGLRSWILSSLPFYGGRYDPMTRALRKIALRYEPVSQQVAHIETKLRDGRALLVRDNVELRQLYEDIEMQQLPIQRNAYLGELLMQHLTELLEREEDADKRERLQAALYDVVMRVQGLRTMEEVHVQYFVSIEMSRQNNSRLGQSIEHTLSLATNVVTVGLAIQSALIRQKRVLEANRRTREFLGDLVAANAVAIRRHTEEIGDLYSNPVISIEKVIKAHDDLVEALNSAAKLRQQGIEVARGNISKLAQMSGSLERQASGLLDKAATETDSVEACDETCR